MMKTNTYLLSVSCTGGETRLRPRLHFAGDWLNAIGFIPGALVQVLPEPNGMVFNLCNDNIGTYSDLFHATRNQGGGLVRVSVKNERDHKVTTFVTSGQYIYSGGLAMGDALVARYDPGTIRVRKLDPHQLGYENIRLTAVSSVSFKYADAPAPKVRLCGDWLNDIGFSIKAIATAESEPGVITLKLQPADTEYNALMKFVRGHKMKIVQVSKGSHIKRDGVRPYIGIAGTCVDRAGFEPEEMLAVSYEPGTIKLQRLDFKKLGF